MQTLKSIWVNSIDRGFNWVDNIFIPMKKAQNSAGFIQIILVLIVVTLIGGAYYFGKVSNKSSVVVESPKVSADPTANWKTYTNAKYDYKFVYPEKWNGPVVTRKGDENSLDVVNFTSSFNDSSVTIYIEKPNTQNFEGEEYILDGNKKGVRVQTSPTHEIVVVKLENYDLVIDFEYTGTDKVDAKLIFDQILSTFKFTNGNISGKYCAGPQNLKCPSGYACKLNVVGKIESGGTCVNEAETNP